MTPSKGLVRGTAYTMTFRRLSRRQLWRIAAPMLLASSWASSSPATADSLKDRLEGRLGLRSKPVAAPSTRYQAEGGEIFVLDRTQSKALLKFQGRDEIWLLERHAAPRGDTLFKNDVGETVLRASKLGGLTLFTRQAPNGQAVTATGPADPLSIRRVMSFGVLFRNLVVAGHRATRAAQHALTVTFLDEATADSSGAIADAAIVVAEAFEALDRAGRRDQLARWRKVYLTLGDKADVKADGEVLVIVLNPKKGFAGRPSSARIARTLKRGR